MPIRLVNVSPTVGRIAPVLGDFGSNVAGSFLAPGTFDGDLFSVLQPYTSDIVGNYAQSSVRTGTIASTMAGFTGAFRPPVAITSNAGRINTLLAGRTAPFAFNTPADPVITSTINVTAGSFASLSAAVNTTGARVIVPAGTYTGSLTATASNVDVVASPAAFLTGNLTLGGGSSAQLTNFRWTGGNIGRLIGSNYRDVLIDNLYAFSGSDMHNFAVAGREVSRLAVINSTFDNDGWTQAGSGYPFFLGRQSPDLEAPHFDVFFGNLKVFSRNGPVHTVRVNSVRRLIIIDCVFNPDGGSQNTGIRLHNNNTNVWLRDHWQVGSLKVDSINPANDPGPSIIDGVFENVRVYGKLAPNDQFALDFALDIQNTGVLRDSTYFRRAGGDTAAITGFADGGGNQTIAWDGVAVPDYSNVGAIR